jgi:uncharacterized protein (DUF1499 family)
MVIMNNIIPKNIGVEDGNLSKMPDSPNAVSSQTFDTSKFVEPFKYLDDYNNSKDIVIQMINEFAGARIITDEGYYIHAVFTTPIMKFKDDVEFYFDDKNKVIHFRSSSRIGYSDNGLNRNRYNKLSEIYYSK